MKPSIRQKLDLLVDRLDEIDRMLSAPSTANDMDQFRKLSRERAEIEPVIETIKDTAVRLSERRHGGLIVIVGHGMILSLTPTM